MAFTRTLRTSFNDTTNQTAPYTTGSYTPTANKVLLAHIFASSSGTFTVNPTLTGNGLTWQFPTSAQYIAGRYHGIAVALTGASPSAGGLQVDFGSLPMTGLIVIVEEWDGVESSSWPLVSAVVDNGGSATSATVTLPSAPTTDKLVVASWGLANVSTGTEGSGFTLGTIDSHNSPTRGLLTEYRTGTTDPNATVSMSSSSWSGIAYSLRPPAGGDVSVSVTPQVLTLATVAPAVTGKAAVTVTPLSLALSQLAPTVSGGASVSSSPLLLTLSQLAPTVTGKALVNVSPLDLMLSTATVIVSTGGDLAVSAGVQTLLLSLVPPVVSGGARFDVAPPTVAVPERRLVVSMPAVSVSGGASHTVTPLDLTLALLAPTVTGKASVTAPPQILSLALVHPTVSAGTGSAVLVIASTQVLTLSMQDPITTVQERVMYGIRTVEAGEMKLR